MARHKEFDVDEALDSALDLFWATGYEATSMQDLVDRLGINRGSLYATFGSKDELYRRAFDRYAERSGAALEEALAGPGPIRDRLGAFLRDLVANPDGRGCFVVNTVCERNPTDPASREATTTSLDATRRLLVDRLRAAAAVGELASDTTPEVAAETVLVLMQGLQVMTKAGADLTELGPVIDTTLDGIT
jgi:TetR/AcrR family transcriptional repressor of nem operon